MSSDSLTEPQRLWIEALRSGKYRKGEGYLRRCGDKFCCLGVACEIAVEAGVIPPPVHDDDGECFAYGGIDGTSYLPEPVQRWLGVRTEAGYYGGGALTTLNDTGENFETIAALIESKPAGLFVEPTA